MEPSHSTPTQPPTERILRRGPGGPIGGVATGLARYFNLPTLAFQVAFVALTFASGFGALLYVAGWLLIPTYDDPEPRPVAMTDQTARIVFGVLFAIGAASALFGSITLGVDGELVIPLLLVGGGFYLLNQRPETSVAHEVPATADQPTSSALVPAATTFGPPDPHWAGTRAEGDVRVASPVEPPAPRTPRAPGPPITSVTLAIAALVVGALLTIDQLTSAVIDTEVVIGSALLVVGGGLVASAFRGRALPLIPVGLVLAMALSVAPALDALAVGGVGPIEERPTQLTAIADTYDLGAGPVDLDFRDVDFTTDKSIDVNVGAGYISIVVPDDVNLELVASSRAGYVSLLGQRQEGVGPDLSRFFAAEGDSNNAATLEMNLEVTFGYVEVRRG